MGYTEFCEGFSGGFTWFVNLRVWGLRQLAYFMVSNPEEETRYYNSGCRHLHFRGGPLDVYKDLTKPGCRSNYKPGARNPGRPSPKALKPINPQTQDPKPQKDLACRRLGARRSFWAMECDMSSLGMHEYGS